MKKIIVITKTIQHREMFLVLWKSEYQWTYDIRHAQVFPSEEHAESALLQLPGETVADFLKVQKLYVADNKNGGSMEYLSCSERHKYESQMSR